jgi:hypothetical protein
VEEAADDVVLDEALHPDRVQKHPGREAEQHADYDPEGEATAASGIACHDSPPAVS